MEEVLTRVKDGDGRASVDIWTADAMQSLVLPPACSWYNGWPQRLYAFYHLHGIQELNFPWSEFLYAWVPAYGLLPFPFAKISAALSAWGTVVELCYGPSATRPQYYRVHYRSLIHMLNCIRSYVEYARNEDGTIKYKQRRQYESSNNAMRFF
jgi:hypothetical protein